MKVFLGTGAVGLFAATLLAACSGAAPETSPPPRDGSLPEANASDPLWCGRGTDLVGAKPADGFCLKHYAQIGEARALAVAPNGDLFVAGPSHDTVGGASGG